jgi:hypothetical protein
MRAHAVAALLLLAGAALSVLASPAAAYPGEPTVTVTVSPTDVTVDASGVNPVDTVFLVNISASNQLGIRNGHTVWVNMTLGVDRGWSVNPGIQNLTFMLDPMETQEESIPVTVTVPPGASATDAAVFFAQFDQENDMPFAQGQTGNRTAQIHIRQVFSTGASFSNGTNHATATQGQDASYNITVQNNGNADTEYDAKVLNAQDLQPNDITVKSTVKAVVPEGGNARVTVVLHASPAAITGTYQVEIRVFATGAGEVPPASSYADLTGTLLIKTAAPPPGPGNNTTNPPPSGNNTTIPGGNNPPPKQGLDAFIEWAVSSQGATVIGVVAAIAVIALLVLGSSRRKKRRREAQLERHRRKKAEQAGRGPPGPGRPVGTGGPRGAGGAPAGPMRPIQRPRSGPGAERTAPQDLRRRGPT